ncbi:MAG TPA: DUF2723 domain-containing protein [Vicinamibacterales bacterium]|nr:DUF2723 domain-containing protein [Vicinamibacterales bacterium]
MRLAAAALVGMAAAVLFGRTAAPGLDLGDTASFQTAVTRPLLTPRDAYPLYFALGKLAWALHGGDPARALNLLSGAAGAAAAGVLTWAAATIWRSTAAGVFAGLLLASSYTFWSQAVIAEVYTLHLLLLALLLAAWLAWDARPSVGRLAVLLFLFALGFAHHLSAVLQTPALLLALGLRCRHDDGVRRATVGPTGVAVAVAAAAAGASLYIWNLYGLWLLRDPDATLRELAATFWFDVTKADWRETLIGTVPCAQLGNRWAMYAWDLRQQFGAAGILAGIAGGAALVLHDPSRAAVLATVYVANGLFAFFYNVGDTHVFLLPSHLVAALAAAGPVALAARALWPGGSPRAGRPIAPAGACLPAQGGARRRALRLALAGMVGLGLAYPLWRIADTWPVVDRHDDHRAERLVTSLAGDLDPFREVLLADAGWELLNGLNYYVSVHRPELPVATAAGLMLHLPSFVADNQAAGRTIVLTSAAARRIEAAYGAHFDLAPDPRLAPVTLLDTARLAAPGQPYVLIVLSPLASAPFDPGEVRAAARALGIDRLPEARYVAVAGRCGRRPVLAAAGNRPFRRRARLAPELTVEIRLESWLPFDTIRRAGFGHVLARGRRVLIAERGASLVLLDDGGAPRAAAYAGGAYAPPVRLLIRAPAVDSSP